MYSSFKGVIHTPAFPENCLVERLVPAWFSSERGSLKTPCAILFGYQYSVQYASKEMSGYPLDETRQESHKRIQYSR